MLVDVVAVSVEADFHLDLEYQNGERRRFDMRPLLEMTPWSRIAAPTLFAQARVAYGAVAWPGGVDVAPETLYDDSVAIAIPKSA